MNIIVSPYKKEGFLCRPDSTLIRAIEEYYIPDEVDQISATPILYIKTLRAGKAISNRFVERYVDSYGFGILLHPTLKKEYFEGAYERPFIENSLDYTSIIPLLSFPDAELKAASNHKFKVTINYKDVFGDFIYPSYNEIIGKISTVSKYCSLRIGDFIAIELTSKIDIAPTDRLTGSVDEDQIFNFKIK